MINFAKNQDIELVIMGASEGWMVSSQLVESNIPVILEPINNLPTSFDRLGSRLENAALLNAAGVKILISYDEWETHNAYLSRQGAGIAVSYGLPWHEAINALTKNVSDTFNIPKRGIGEKVAQDVKQEIMSNAKKFFIIAYFEFPLSTLRTFS